MTTYLEIFGDGVNINIKKDRTQFPNGRLVKFEYRENLKKKKKKERMVREKSAN